MTATKSSEFPDAQQRVIGETAWNGQFPHQVSLQDKSGTNFCGASVIRPLLLVTAAHCFNKYKPADVRTVTGAHDLTNYNGNEQIREVTHVIKHEDWNETTWDNDIAILVLNESLVFDTYTKPIDILETETSGKSKQSVL